MPWQLLCQNGTWCGYSSGVGIQVVWIFKWCGYLSGRVMWQESETSIQTEAGQLEIRIHQSVSNLESRLSVGYRAPLC